MGLRAARYDPTSRVRRFRVPGSGFRVQGWLIGMIELIGPVKSAALIFYEKFNGLKVDWFR